MEAIPHPSPLPAGVKHATQICSPSNRRRPAQPPQTSSGEGTRKSHPGVIVGCKSGTPSSTALRRLGEGKWPPLGSNGVRSLEIQHCLAALHGLWMLRRPGVLRMIRKIGKSALQGACRRASLRSPPPLRPLAQRSAIKLPRVACRLAWPGDFSWEFGLWSLCLCLLFPMQRRDDSHVQHASLQPGHECAHHLCQRQS